MVTSPDKGRSTITGALPVLSDVLSVAPMSVGLSMFKDAKMDELVNLYSKAPSDERTRVFNILEPIYPTEQSRLEEIKKGKETE